MNIATLGKLLDRAEHYAWVLVAPLVLILVACFVYQRHAARDANLRVALAVRADSLKMATASRDSLASILADEDRYAEAQHLVAERATVRADSLTGLAERHRAGNRIIDSTHVAITVSDTQHVAEIATVPVEITEQLRLDSAALAGQDARGAAKEKELVVRLTEIGTLRTLVHVDSLSIRQLEGEVATLESVKTPTLTFTEGVVGGAILAVVVKIAVALLVH